MVNNTSKSQRAYLKAKGQFTIACKHDTFPEKDIRLLKDYGHLYDALNNGTLLPINEEQEQFIDVARRKRVPQTDHEWAWFRYIKRKEIEAKDPVALYSTPQAMNDSFYNREMAKNYKNSVYNIKKKNNEQ